MCLTENKYKQDLNIDIDLIIAYLYILLGDCKEFYLKFMICLAENDNLTSACREDSKAYLGCR